jgi:putative FmdB family regulatory protein
MPIYEFYCESCDRKFEKLVIRRDAAVHCPGCDTADVRRLISVCSFGSSDGTVQAAGTSSCSSCSATSCSSCGGGSAR